jgi:cytochrome c553
MLMKRFLFGLMGMLPLLATAAGDAEAGKALAVPCGACHGVNGVATVPGAPNLAGQSQRYLVAQLEMIKSGARAAPLMAGQLNSLSSADLENIGAYFAAMPAPVGQADGTQLLLGEQIYRAGVATKGVPACTACHAPTGAGNPPAGFPHIGGQRSDYVVAQLTAYREGVRGTDANFGNAMQQIANGLTDSDIKAVASYIQGLH